MDIKRAALSTTLRTIDGDCSILLHCINSTNWFHFLVSPKSTWRSFHETEILKSEGVAERGSGKHYRGRWTIRSLLWIMEAGTIPRIVLSVLGGFYITAFGSESSGGRTNDVSEAYLGPTLEGLGVRLVTCCMLHVAYGMAVCLRLSLSTQGMHVGGLRISTRVFVS